MKNVWVDYQRPKGLLGKFRLVENLEKYIAQKNNRLRIHEKKWNLTISYGSESAGLNIFIAQHIDGM